MTCIAVIVGCFESNLDKRNFLLAAAENEMISDDYVYIYVENTREGFGKSSENIVALKRRACKTHRTFHYASQNFWMFLKTAMYRLGLTPFWVDQFNDPPDGKDLIAKTAAENVIVVGQAASQVHKGACRWTLNQRTPPSVGSSRQFWTTCTIGPSTATTVPRREM